MTDQTPTGPTEEGVPAPAKAPAKAPVKAPAKEAEAAAKAKPEGVLTDYGVASFYVKG